MFAGVELQIQGPREVEIPRLDNVKLIGDPKPISDSLLLLTTRDCHSYSLFSTVRLVETLFLLPNLIVTLTLSVTAYWPSLLPIVSIIVYGEG